MRGREELFEEPSYRLHHSALTGSVERQLLIWQQSSYNKKEIIQDGGRNMDQCGDADKDHRSAGSEPPLVSA